MTRYAISIRAHHQAVAGLQAADERDPVETDIDDVVPTPLLRALNGMVAKTQLEVTYISSFAAIKACCFASK